MKSAFRILVVIVCLIVAGVRANAQCDFDFECDDGILCTNDVCVGAPGGFCSNTNNNAACDDGFSCTSDVCDPSDPGADPNGCVITAVNAACDDGFSCTSDVCDPSDPGADPNGCVITAVNAACDDGFSCTSDVCDPSNPGADPNGCVITAVNAACDDGFSCTSDVCDPSDPGADPNGCVITAVNAACDDGNVCNGIETCSILSGCQNGIPLNCDDSDPCTIDFCAGGCLNVPIDCNDNNACTSDGCDISGNCTNAPFTCDDGDACTIDDCVPATGCITSGAVTCDDGSECTADACVPATGCTFTAITCDDGDACTTDGCDPTVPGGCTTTLVVCNDGDACNGVETCNVTVGCQAGTSPNCNDGIACTNDACNAAVGCVNTPVNTNCNDSDACTDDFCAGGCINSPVNCDDGDACTIDDCVPATGCTTSGAVTCDDGSECTADACVAATGCTFTAITCDDGDACTTDGCDPTVPGGCTTTLVVCNDGDACNGVETCNVTVGCQAGTAPNCNDGIACTNDACNAAVGCVNTPVNTNCNDSDACTDDFCAGGCINSPVNCDDGDACTIDDCVPATGCTTSGAVTCDDGSACTTDACNPASGCAFTAIVCDDGDPCNGFETCDPLSGCRPGFPPSCDDGDACNGIETCVGGVCVSGISPLCDDGDVCNGSETCDPSMGCLPGTPLSCDDGNPCNGVETCHAVSGCLPGTPPNCDDGSACTIDGCDPLSGGCTHLLNCSDADVCTVDECIGTSCNHTPLSCDDANPCNGIETCDAALGCQPGVAPVCDDGNICNGLETCNVISGCTPGTPLSCDDANPCNGTETCDAVSGCLPGTPPNCDDGSACTIDGCDPLSGGCTHLLNCSDGNACTVDECLGTTCHHMPFSCDDGNACTADGCSPLSGCTVTQVICNDGDLCTIDACDPLAGCVFTPRQIPVPRFTISDACRNAVNAIKDNTIYDDPAAFYWIDLFNDGIYEPGNPYPANRDTFISVNSVGTFEIKFRPENQNGCRDSVVLTFSVNANPLADFTSDTSVCLGSPLLFTNTTTVPDDPIPVGSLSYEWNFGDNSTSSDINPVHTYNTLGQPLISLKATTDKGCTHTKTVQPLTIIPLPLSVFSAGPACFDRPVIFTDVSNFPHILFGNVDYIWNFGDGSPLRAIIHPQDTVHHKFPTLGAFQISVTAYTTQAGVTCSIDTTFGITVHPNPTANFIVPNVCEDAEVQFTNLSSIASGDTLFYQWDFGTGLGVSSFNENPVFTYSTPGPKTVTLRTISEFQCDDIKRKTLEVYEKPAAAFDVGDVCHGEPSRFVIRADHPPGTISLYSWDFGDGTNSVDKEPRHLYDTPADTTKTFLATLALTSSNGCVDTARNAAIVHRLPFILFSHNPQLAFCDGEQVTLAAFPLPPPASNYAFSWSPGGETNDTIVVAAQGDYCVTVTDISTPAQCMADSCIEVIVYDSPLITAEPDTIVSKGFPVTLMAQGGVSYQWSADPPDASLNGSLPSPTVIPLQTTTYTVTGTDANGCTGTAAVTVTVREDFVVNPTNVITPNGDGFNDFWVIKNLRESYSGNEVLVFDRWGTKVFDARNYDNSWDGTYKGRELPQGPYYYVIKFDNSDRVYKGSVSIVR